MQARSGLFGLEFDGALLLHFEVAPGQGVVIGYKLPKGPELFLQGKKGALVGRIHSHTGRL